MRNLMSDIYREREATIERLKHYGESWDQRFMDELEDGWTVDQIATRYGMTVHDIRFITQKTPSKPLSSTEIRTKKRKRIKPVGCY